LNGYFILINLVRGINGAVDGRAVPEIKIPVGALGAIARDGASPPPTPIVQKIFVVEYLADGADGNLGLKVRTLLLTQADAVMTHTLAAEVAGCAISPTRP
jgi:hypothetical protein